MVHHWRPTTYYKVIATNFLLRFTLLVNIKVSTDANRAVERLDKQGKQRVQTRLILNYD